MLADRVHIRKVAVDLVLRVSAVRVAETKTVPRGRRQEAAAKNSVAMPVAKGLEQMFASGL